MIVAESTMEHDCLRVVVASLLELDANVVPWPPTPIDDSTWQQTWAELRDWLAGRGWHLLWHDVDPCSFAEWLASMEGSWHYVIASVTHPAMGEWSHAIATRGDDVVLWPPTGTADPPRDELQLVGVGLLVPIDPAAFELTRRPIEPNVAAVYVFRAGRHVGHLVDDDDDELTACGLQLAGTQLVLAGGHRLCRWCELAAGGHPVDLLEAVAA